MCLGMYLGVHVWVYIIYLVNIHVQCFDIFLQFSNLVCVCMCVLSAIQCSSNGPVHFSVLPVLAVQPVHHAAAGFCSLWCLDPGCASS